ncbi:hypothetical protein PAPYR_10579 [Paratrimastix pyriformis]|uniref:Uncharacterized protein n=1 Tax=Paratrimastix pyriformis TaxID=342808 RepID=A0ABQ8U5N5_9EUKA|nr:hypothetical protein PAPYR_10579 [Paratrimastix pyriformis]
MSLSTSAFESELASQRDLELIFFGAAIGALLISYLFLFRVNLVKGELTKTALMRALLPSSAFARPARPSIRPPACPELLTLNWCPCALRAPLGWGMSPDLGA